MVHAYQHLRHHHRAFLSPTLIPEVGLHPLLGVPEKVHIVIRLRGCQILATLFIARFILLEEPSAVSVFGNKLVCDRYIMTFFAFEA